MSGPASWRSTSDRTADLDLSMSALLIKRAQHSLRKPTLPAGVAPGGTEINMRTPAASPFFRRIEPCLRGTRHSTPGPTHPGESCRRKDRRPAGEGLLLAREAESNRPNEGSPTRRPKLPCSAPARRSTADGVTSRIKLVLGPSVHMEEKGNTLAIDSIVDEFTLWTNGRTISSIGTNDGAPCLAFQTWHHFKEAFPPELIHRAVNSTRKPARCVLDPFGGSGTTALASQMLGIDSLTIEVNPFLVDMIRAKLNRYDIDLLVRDLGLIRRRSRLCRTALQENLFSNLPVTFVEPGVNGRWIFDGDVAARLTSTINAIRSLENEDSRRLFMVLVGGILPALSNVTVNGKGRRYRRNWKDSRVDPDRVDVLFASRAEAAILDIQRHSRRPDVRSLVVHGDARAIDYKIEADLSVFSPPYPNSFDYTDVYNLELWVLGYLQSMTDNRILRTATLTSHVQLMREYRAAPTSSLTLATTIEKLKAKQDTLWSRWIPAMVGAYFNDLSQVMKRVRDSTTRDGECWMVVGDSRYAGVLIPVGKILAELAGDSNWGVREVTPFRHMKSSAQQGWKPELAESLVVLHAE